MLTMSKQFGSVVDILSDAIHIVDVTGHCVEFEFNGVWVNVPPSVIQTQDDMISAVKAIMRMVKAETKHKVYL